MTVDELTAILLNNQLINIKDTKFNDLYYGINDKLDDEKHKNILNKEIYYIEPYSYKNLIVITIKEE